MSDALDRLAEILGHRFEDEALLKEALTHASAGGPERRDYQRLEFLGDRVLGLIISSHLVVDDPDAPEGMLALRLNALVRGNTLAEVAGEIGLDAFVRTGPGRKRRSGPRSQVGAGRRVRGGARRDLSRWRPRTGAGLYRTRVGASALPLSKMSRKIQSRGCRNTCKAATRVCRTTALSPRKARRINRNSRSKS